MPKHLEKIDIGNASYNDEKIKYLIGNYVNTSFNDSLMQTIKYFKENI